MRPFFLQQSAERPVVKQRIASSKQTAHTILSALRHATQ